MSLFDALVDRARGVGGTTTAELLVRPVDALALVTTIEPLDDGAIVSEQPTTLAATRPQVPTPEVDLAGTAAQRARPLDASPISSSPDPGTPLRVVEGVRSPKVIERLELHRDHDHHHHHETSSRETRREILRERTVEVPLPPTPSPTIPAPSPSPAAATSAPIAVTNTRVIAPAPAPAAAPPRAQPSAATTTAEVRPVALAPRAQPTAIPTRAAEPPQPTVHVHIDRIVVRAEPPTRPAAKPTQTPANTGADLLARYLAHRSSDRR